MFSEIWLSAAFVTQTTVCWNIMLSNFGMKWPKSQRKLFSARKPPLKTFGRKYVTLQPNAIGNIQEEYNLHTQWSLANPHPPVYSNFKLFPPLFNPKNSHLQCHLWYHSSFSVLLFRVYLVSEGIYFSFHPFYPYKLPIAAFLVSLFQTVAR